MIFDKCPKCGFDVFNHSKCAMSLCENIVSTKIGEPDSGFHYQIGLVCRECHNRLEAEEMKIDWGLI